MMIAEEDEQSNDSASKQSNGDDGKTEELKTNKEGQVETGEKRVDVEKGSQKSQLGKQEDISQEYKQGQ